MARAGITKYQVEKAHKSLMLKGIHPSIDALRTELGNTGSKTTISRYLKELEADQCIQMEDEALLSQGIKDLIAKLASKLHQEANDVVEQSKENYQSRIKELERDNCRLKETLDSKDLELEKSRAEVLLLNSNNKTLSANLFDLTNTIAQSNSKIDELAAVINEKDKQIQSLNENHQHTRDSLVHYRDSVKEQREQEHRQYEQQVQQLQLELRQLNQTLIVKQGDITELNKDNSRLVSELGNLQKQLIVVENKHGLVSGELEKLRVARESEKNKLVLTLKELESLKIRFKEFTDDKKARDKQLKISEQHINKIEIELEIKNRLLEQLNIQKGTS